MSRNLVLCPALACLALAGCLSTENAKVRVARDRADMARQTREARLSEGELAELRDDERERARLSPELEASNRRYAEERAWVRATARGGEHPWRDYEEERRAIFYRQWGDAPIAKPPLEPDSDGPPGWIGPYAVGPAAAASPAGGGGEEGAEGGEPAGGDSEGPPAEDDDWGGDSGGDDSDGW